MSATDDFDSIVQSIADEGQSAKPVQFLPTSPGNALHFSPELLVDLLVHNPNWNMKDLGQAFGRSAGWAAQALSMKAVQDALTPRRHEVSNPEFAMTLEERFQALTIRSLSVMQEKLESGKALPDLTVLKAAELGVKALGMGQKLKSEDVPAETSKNTSEMVADKIMAAMARRKAATAEDVEAVEVPNGEQSSN